MLQAFDTLLQLSVFAEAAAKIKVDEPFRYECLCCGEEVYVAAAESKKRAPHFRHRRGNSDRDCDLYLGRYGIAGALNAAKSRQHNRTDIYFDNVQNVFYASFSFPDEKIYEYESKSCVLEFKTSINGMPYDRVRIDHGNFSPDNTVYFPLKLVSNDCFISITNVSYNSHYQILGDNDFPTFFRMPIADNRASRAKRIIGGKIYTAEQYYVLAKDINAIQKIGKYNQVVSLGQIKEIDALGGTIFGATLEINSIADELRELFEYFNYELVTSEVVTPFWPPSWIEDKVICTNQEKIYILPSFEIIPNSNISCNSHRINENNGIYEIDLSDSVRIRFSNVDLSFERRLPQNQPSIRVVERSTKTMVRVDETEVCFMVGNDGYRELPAGKHRLTKSDCVIKYQSNYPVSIYTYPEIISKSGVAILRDILTYYKVTIPFDESLVQGCPLSAIAKTYIEECRISNQINICALGYIKAGKI